MQEEKTDTPARYEAFETVQEIRGENISFAKDFEELKSSLSISEKQKVLSMFLDDRIDETTTRQLLGPAFDRFLGRRKGFMDDNWGGLTPSSVSSDFSFEWSLSEKALATAVALSLEVSGVVRA